MKKLHKNTLIFLTLLFNVNNIFSQHILHQPIIGAITENSAKILFFSDTLIDYTLTISNQEGIMSIEHHTEDSIFFCNKLTISELMPNQTCYYTLKTKNNTEEFRGTFKTAPKKNSTEKFSFVFGSCTEQSQDFGIFKTIEKQKPNFFIHLGDWLYNKYNATTDLSEQIELFHLRDKFIARYKLLGNFLKNTPIDYIFDDEDGIYDDFSKSSFTVIEANNKSTQVKEIPYPDSLKTILKKSLAEFFPSYDDVNNQDSYHKFSYGNADFFVLDNRSTRTPNTEIFTTNKKGKLKYSNPNEHEILDSTQMKWLLDGLKKSEAKWKFIVSGVTFNKSYKKVFNICMRLQNRILPNGKNGAYIAASLSAMWFAYPNSQQKLIEQVVTISGHPDIFYYTDYWGNTAGQFTIIPPHSELTIDSRTVIETKPSQIKHHISTMDEWKTLENLGSFNFDIFEYTIKEKLKASDTIEQILHSILLWKETPLATIQRCSEYIYEEFKYIKGITTVESTIDE
ncbi:MAG TPA: alkaline phosphatase D family protein, partial [Chitinophagales bacterium]|nr:alkaline phosphatase D family protein [Chitinophagales bacterium]